jgi:hypothetical protein
MQRCGCPQQMPPREHFPAKRLKKLAQVFYICSKMGAERTGGEAYQSPQSRRFLVRYQG